ncbi:sugar kinase [Streptomyces sp. AV19]|uniref:sugar kinase n=1 Tax=Streptomyces sp. AV19 TaxID=2793068 RepID=UPI002413A6BC|nr:sugar kinase [Streptomyces sp. AV19]MDG4534424.1 sugar kinase [Streptomyces sp. AV19]
MLDVICLGEALIAFRPAEDEGLGDAPSFVRGVGGAESNVACALSRWGHRTGWIGRVGTDGFGTHVLETLAAHGVDTSAARRDPHRSTGLYFRTPGERATTAGDPAPGRAEVAYYRAGSAASALSPDLVDRDTAWAGRVLHLSGITAALSASCLALLRALTAPGSRRPLVSFDVNYRVGLWRTAPESPDVLMELARRSDIVFVGEDEAEAAWGVRGAGAIRAALPEPAVLVVKQGAAGATVHAGDGLVVSESAPAVEVVAPVGAGDAFAAGFLSGTLRGLPYAARLRHGHLLAAAALTSPGDLADPPPAREHADRLVALGSAAWGRLRLGPGWADGTRAQDLQKVQEERTA